MIDINEVYDSSNRDYNRNIRYCDPVHLLRVLFISTRQSIARFDCDTLYDYLNSITFFRIRDVRHSEKLNETIKRLIDIEIAKTNNSNYELRVDDKPIDVLPFYNHILSHLKKYEGIINSLQALSDFVRNTNGIHDNLKDKIRDEMAKQYSPDMLEMDVMTVSSKNAYAIAFLEEKIFCFFERGQKDEILNQNVLQKQNSDEYGWILGYPRGGGVPGSDNIITSDNELDVEVDKFMLVVRAVANNRELKQKFNDLKNRDRYVTDFRIKLRELSENIELGHRIKGKCSIGF